jgi:hypothetical protein
VIHVRDPLSRTDQRSDRIEDNPFGHNRPLKKGTGSEP